NAGSKWSREAQTKFVPRGLRQDSIINGSLFHYNRKYFVNPHLFATEPIYPVWLNNVKSSISKPKTCTNKHILCKTLLDI
ncbi:MAG: hypothetical protein IJF06_04225, partial [Bacteroidaceae bacterium]|nr:hypothetical protein [Bacteroidaceae bacterium]